MKPFPLKPLGLTLAAALAAGCTTGVRLGAPPPGAPGAQPAGFDRPIRADTLDRTYFIANAGPALARLKSASDGSLDILALSGGGAGGAYGAGALVGFTESGKRPRFEVVTGVSTGALIAPFAFLGPDWDPKLREAYSGEATKGLLQTQGLSTLFSTAVYRGAPLRGLIDRFITPELVAAVATESRGGRVLLVATTNLDREETTIWDMGAIAEAGGDKALELFREVLTASASVPGVFPPVLIPVTDGKTDYAEMHVDGGASTPFFLVPDIVLFSGFRPEELKRGHIYVIVNGQVSSEPQTTQVNAVSIAARSFSAMLNHMTRTALAQTEGFAAANTMDFHFTTIPSEVAFGGSLAFDPAGMKAIFDYGERCAAANLSWMTPAEALTRMERASDVKPPAGSDCPVIANKP